MVIDVTKSAREIGTFIDLARTRLQPKDYNLPFKFEAG